MKHLAFVIGLIIAGAGPLAAQDEIVDGRRDRVRLQGGIVPLEHESIPLLSVNYLHRFFDVDRKIRVGASGEIGAHWIFPYGDMGIEIANDYVNGRLAAGGVVSLIFGGAALPYISFSLGVVPLRGDVVDVELEARHMITSGVEDGITTLTLGLAFH